MKRYIRTLGAIFFMAASQGWAALTWSPEYSVDQFWLGDYSGGNYVVSVKIKEIPAGCAGVSTNAGYQTFSFWSTTAYAGMSQLLMSQAIYADAQERKISIQYDDTNCNTSLGWYMRGIKVLPE